MTSRKIAYVGWMLIYLLSLPIWNFVLPLYAYWHMDDFSWGATRVVQGENKKDNHGDADGKFDPSHIVMKRWAEFERERRWKSGTHSRDSTYDVVQRTGSPERSGSTRYSVVSSDTFHSNPSGQHDQFGARSAQPVVVERIAVCARRLGDVARQERLGCAGAAGFGAAARAAGTAATDAKQRSGASPPGTVVVPRPRATSPSNLPHKLDAPGARSVHAFSPTQHSAARLPTAPSAGVYEAYPTRTSPTTRSDR